MIGNGSRRHLFELSRQAVAAVSFRKGANAPIIVGSSVQDSILQLPYCFLYPNPIIISKLRVPLSRHMLTSVIRFAFNLKLQQAY